MLRHALTPALTIALALVVAPAAPAATGGGGASGNDDGLREARVTGTCGEGASSQMRLRSRDGTIELDFRLEGPKARQAWRITVIQERRVVLRRTLRTRTSNRSLRLRSDLRDQAGADSVTVRASAADGRLCTAVATLAG